MFMKGKDFGTNFNKEAVLMIGVFRDRRTNETIKISRIWNLITFGKEYFITLRGGGYKSLPVEDYEFLAIVNE